MSVTEAARATRLLGRLARWSEAGLVSPGRDEPGAERGVRQGQEHEPRASAPAGHTPRAAAASPASDLTRQRAVDPPPPPGGDGPAERLARARALLERFDAARRSAARPAMGEGVDRTLSPVGAGGRANTWADPEIRSAPRPGGAERVPTPDGEVHLRRLTLAATHCHGRVAVGRAATTPASGLAWLARDPALRGVDLARALYVDTETTGLSSGTGTLPFLIGLAFFQEGALCLEQLVLDGPGREGAMLHWFTRRLAQASCLVSFNGKSFDLPLLLTRLILNRVPLPPLPPHLDLLPCARRSFRRRLGDVRLTSLEERVLSMRRERDIAGHEIPALYWSWVRGAPGAELSLVLEHNGHDLVAMAALLAELGRRVAGVDPRGEPEDHLSLAEAAHRAAEPELALAYAQAAAEGGGPEEVTVLAWELIGRVHLRARQRVPAAWALEQALAAAAAGTPAWARLQLRMAKLLEHGLKDPERALAHGRWTAAAEGLEANHRRVARLERKRRARAAPPPAE